MSVAGLERMTTGSVASALSYRATQVDSYTSYTSTVIVVRKWELDGMGHTLTHLPYATDLNKVELEAQGLGCRRNGVFVGVCIYADDIVYLCGAIGYGAWLPTRWSCVRVLPLTYTLCIVG